MIGSGIFITSADVARSVGSPGLMMGCMADIRYNNCYRSFVLWRACINDAKRWRTIRLSQGSVPSSYWISVWMTTFLVIQCGSIAAGGLVRLCQILGSGSSPGSLKKIYCLNSAPLGINTTMIVAIAMIAFLTWLNTRGIGYRKTCCGTYFLHKGDSSFRIYSYRNLCNKGITSWQINRKSSGRLAG